MMFPDVVPYLNHAIEKIQIPTHDTWSRASIEEYVDEARLALLEARDSIEELKETIREVRQS
jgi:signal recognition particle GTPase